MFEYLNFYCTFAPETKNHIILTVLLQVILNISKSK